MNLSRLDLMALPAARTLPLGAFFLVLQVLFLSLSSGASSMPIVTSTPLGGGLALLPDRGRNDVRCPGRMMQSSGRWWVALDGLHCSSVCCLGGDRLVVPDAGVHVVGNSEVVVRVFPSLP